MSEKDFYLYIDGRPVKVSEEVYQEYYRGERKERYFMEDLKTEQMEIEEETQSVKFIPGREDSYERLLDVNRQFSAPGEPMEEQVMDSLLIKAALHTLSDEEQALIYELFYLDKTEREVSAALNMARTTLQRKRNRALEKLRFLLEKEF